MSGRDLPADWDPVRAWRFVRASRAYRRAWNRRLPQPGLPEAAPFPVRLQTAVDLAALEWGMRAWENPYAADGPLAPYWVRGTMWDGRVAPGGTPLARVAAAGGATVSGLRLGDGALILRIERDGAAALVRIRGGGGFPADGGLLLVREVARIEDVWSAIPAPRPGRVRGTGIVSFWWRWKVRRRGGRTGRSPWRSGAASGSTKSITPTAGCTRGSSAG